ncbi:response regulator transcription factor [Thorsellia anophelis]|uniref:Response regulator receiver domain-containing protein n=1 Tax=Thorsellia anophelis DSM 18579 TaxID=1123402 RepID=A0A1I0BB68_9GAMM|nr:response regulator transcription factor [Thorsellia anophelis]SET03387.1 Response regulator receiver domain-containing protein [Thorsellia anophelis DSM 18579]
MKILLVEDNLELSEQIAHALSDIEYTLDITHDGIEAHFFGREFEYCAIILDLGLPKLDGLSILKQWRSSGIHTPVIVLTARGEWHEKVLAIDSGADDYLTKPFHIEELLARLRAVIRRANGHSSAIIEVGALTLDTRAQIVYLNQQRLSLTSHEYKLLAYFMHHPNQIITKTKLMEQLYEQDSDRDSNTLEVFIGRLRKKMPKDMIQTVRGTGYQLVVEAE